MSKDPEREPGSPRPAEERPRRVVSLLGQRGAPADAPPGARDAEPHGGGDARPDRAASSGADPLRSEHSTFRDLEAPRDDFDPERARAICAQVAREVLRDFAPALVLLPAESRPRAQAAIAYARTLLDFARDRSLEGERLAQINRVEFELEAALGGEPTGQPVFVQLAALERQHAWPREAFDELASIARSRVTTGVPARAAAAEAQRRRLAAAGLHALLGGPPDDEAVTLAAAALRTASLLGWHEALWFDRPDLGLGAQDAPSSRFAAAVANEERAVLAELQSSRAAVAGLPERFRPAARYAALAAGTLARRAAATPDVTSPPRLSAWERLRMLLRARFGW